MELYLHSPNTPSYRGAQLWYRDNTWCVDFLRSFSLPCLSSCPVVLVPFLSAFNNSCLTSSSDNVNALLIRQLLHLSYEAGQNQRCVQSLCVFRKSVWTVFLHSDNTMYTLPCDVYNIYMTAFVSQETYVMPKCSPIAKFQSWNANIFMEFVCNQGCQPMAHGISSCGHFNVSVSYS
jgi:hypothetical protein